VLDPEKADPIICGGSGSVGWPGAWGGWWQADPGDSSVLIFLAHNMVELNQFAQGVGFGVFDAIIRFQSLASSRPTVVEAHSLRQLTSHIYFGLIAVSLLHDHIIPSWDSRAQCPARRWANELYCSIDYNLVLCQPTQPATHKGLCRLQESWDLFRYFY
jgi:hypothetical protein